MIGVGRRGCAVFNLTAEHGNELGALSLGETADRLRRRDPADLQDLVHLHAPVLRNSEEHVEHLRRLDEVRRLHQEEVDARAAGLQITLERRPLGPDLVRALERLHALDEGTLWSSRGGLDWRLRRWRHGRRVYSAGSRRQGVLGKLAFT